MFSVVAAAVLLLHRGRQASIPGIAEKEQRLRRIDLGGAGRINKKLVIDLGGRHAQTLGTVAVDTLGLTKGNVYDLAVFHAERHTDQSNFQIQTTLAFTDCGETLVRF